jgi:hypothetical protein
MILVSFVCAAHEIKIYAFLHVEGKNLPIKNSSPSDMRLVATYQMERSFLMSTDDKNLAHTRWNCKVHTVFITKYRWKVIYEIRIITSQMVRK